MSSAASDSSAPRRRGLLRTLAWQLALGAGLCAGLALWLLPDGALAPLGTALATTEPGPVLLAGALYPLVMLSRARRLAVAVPHLAGAAATTTAAPPPLGRMARVAALHSMLASFAPMRLGELSLVWLLHRAAGTPLAAGSALLLVLRLLDLAVVLGAGLLALALLPAARAALPQGGAIAAALLALLAVGLLLAPWLAQRLRRLRPPGAATGRLARLWTTLLGALAAQTPARLGHLLGWTLVIWGLIFAMAWLCANATATPVGLAGGIAGGSATALASVLPVNTFANAGTFEAAWVLALIPAGLDEATALATGLVFHGISLLGSALLGGLALLGGGRRLLYGAPPQ
ncbi:lysylphosphatidylglycerol synthase domain-containing protein [Roseospira goensis]|uniref:Uncharacterized membrane protein YbhN (UPF0104 family) n=1 Tax=Roseospira goensis TaxID=391922 RepID=A0A7W6WIK3_9PROT|nr:lysylphosphatidylglycerol synthase domain-containing protein [Roseospira goensis]MBB4284326.1 uncharacterized membrane protein YbhN (UPF0104 family) [Roseospira goensis]